MTEPERTENQVRFGKGARERARVRAEQAWALRERGLSYRAIAQRLGVSHVTIKGYLDRTEDRIARGMDEVARRILIRDLAQVESILSEAIIGYSRSKKAGKRLRKKVLPGNPPRIVEMTLDTELRDGDPKFLSVALSAIASRRDMLERFDLARRLGEIEKQLESISDRRATW